MGTGGHASVAPQGRARPVLILWPSGPVALVYDVVDTAGRDLPKDAASFFAVGCIDENRLASVKPLMSEKNIEWCWGDAGDKHAGSIRVSKRATDKEATRYRMHINRNHEAAVQVHHAGA